MHDIDLLDVVRLTLYFSWIVMILLVLKLLLSRSRWRQPFRGNGPMLWALFMMLLGVEWTRARNIATGDPVPPPFVPSVVLSAVATVLIFIWLWQQMELRPRWLRNRRRHHPARPSSADYTAQEDRSHGSEHR